MLLRAVGERRGRVTSESGRSSSSTNAAVWYGEKPGRHISSPWARFDFYSLPSLSVSALLPHHRSPKNKLQDNEGKQEESTVFNTAGVEQVFPPPQWEFGPHHYRRCCNDGPTGCSRCSSTFLPAWIRLNCRVSLPTTTADTDGKLAEKLVTRIRGVVLMTDLRFQTEQSQGIASVTNSPLSTFIKHQIQISASKVIRFPTMVLTTNKSFFFF